MASRDGRELDRMFDQALSRRELLRRGGVGAGSVAFAALLAACSKDKTTSGSSSGATGGSGLTSPPASGAGVNMDDLVAAANDEGALNTIALPPDWANYGEIMSTFQSKYPDITLTNANPNGSSSDELTSVKTLSGQDRAPDVLDVGPPFALQGVQESLFTPYKVSTWDSIPDNLKDANGMWAGDYWGAIAFGTNTDVASNPPQAWADLTKPEYKGQVAMNGDPRTSGSAFAGVFAASLANGGSLDDIQPGIDFFGHLKDIGNYITVDATPGTVAKGETPITIDWDYLQLAYNKEFSGQITWQVTVPTDGVFGNNYCQAINATAPNPYAARLWEEFLYSDEGQLLWLKGYSHPVRFQDLSDRGVIPAGPAGRASHRRPRTRTCSSPPGIRPRRRRRRSRTIGRRRSVSSRGTGVIEAEAKAPADTKPRKVRRLAWLGVVPFFLFTFAFLIYPSAVDPDRSVPERAGAVHDGAHPQAADARHDRGVLDEHQAERRHGAPRRADGLPHGVRRRLALDAPLGAVGAHHVLRRGGELRRSAARVRVHRDARRDGHHHEAAEGCVRHRSLRRGLLALLVRRPGDRLSLFPDPTDDPRDRAGARRPSSRVARGRR